MVRAVARILKLLDLSIQTDKMVFRTGEDLAKNIFAAVTCKNKIVRRMRRGHLFVVPGRGLEPPRLTACAPQAHVVTNYTTRADFCQ